MIARAALIVVALARVAAADSTEPYTMPFGDLDAVERAAKLTALGQAAFVAQDAAGGTRAFAAACWYDALARFDANAPACQRVRGLLREHPLADAEAIVLGIEGTLAAWRLDVTSAVDHLQRAIALGATIDLDRPEAIPILRAHFTLGAILAEAGRYDLALAEIELARGHALVIGAGELVAWTDVWSCRTHDLLGDVERAIDHCARADAYLARDPDRFLAMNLRWQQGELELGRGHAERALARYRESYELAHARGGELLRAGMKLNIGAALVALGNIEEGRAWFGALEAAVARGELPAAYATQVAEQQGELDVRAGDHAAAARRFEVAAGSPMHWLSIRALGRLAWTRTQLGDLAGARQTHEEAIRRIERERVALDGSLQRTLYMGLHAAPYRELAALVAREPDGAARALAIAERGRARGLLDALAAATSAATVKPRSAEDIQRLLSPEQVLVEYLSAEASLLALVVTHDAVTTVELPAAGTAAQLAPRIALYRQRLLHATDLAELAPLADALYRDLVAPVLIHAPAARVVMIAADGALHDLPFEAILPEPVTLARIPSGSMLGAHTPRAARGMLVAVPPDTARLGALEAARDEAAFLEGGLAEVTVLREAAATLDALRTNASGRAVLHFAGHAVIDPAMPLRSALVLAASADHDGWWRAADLYRRPLEVELVVLAACSTARGAPGGGEGVASLSRAFMHAGARTTIATAWDIDDAASARFTKLLYPRLAAGDTIAEAVATARRELRRTRPPREWAGFVVTGDPSLRVALVANRAPPRAIGRWPWFGAGGVIALLAIGWTLWRRRR